MRIKPSAIIAAALLLPLALIRPAGAQTSAPPGVRALLDIAYAHPGGKPVKLDLFLPVRSAGKLPVIVWIHGGGWREGSKAGCPAVGMATQGYAVVSIDYRLVPAAKWPAQIYDCKAAIRWVRAHAGEYSFNPDRIGVLGASAGGHLVALLGTTDGVKALEGDEGNSRFSSRVQAVCDLFGPTDFPFFLANLKGDNSAAVKKMAAEFLGNSPDAPRRASPITYVSRRSAPFLIMHGDKDPLVPLSQSQRLHAALRKAGVPSTLVVVKGAGHGFAGNEYVLQILAFFNKHLKK